MNKKILFAWGHLEEIILVPAFAISTILIFLQIVLRLFNNSLSWSEELVRYMYIWETWLGVSYATKKGSQLRITMIKDRLPQSIQQIIEIFVTIVWIAFACFVFYQGIRTIGTISMYGQKSSALRIPMQYCYLAVPTGMSLMSIRLVEGIAKKIVNGSKGGKAE